MKKIFGIISTIFILSGCTSAVDPMPGSKNENVVSINIPWEDRGKGPMYGPTLAVANKWCDQFNKTAKYLKNTFSGFQYVCIEK